MGVAFEAAEMRWGIRADSSDDNLTEAMCLRKLEECKSESGGLFFLSLWADKYGFCPLPRGEARATHTIADPHHPLTAPRLLTLATPFGTHPQSSTPRASTGSSWQ